MDFEELLKSNPCDHLSANEVLNMKAAWDAAIDEAIRVASEMADEYKDLGAAHGGAEIAKAIKELKE